MATRAKEPPRLKPKANSASPSTTQSDGRRVPRASITGSPDRDPSKPPEKAILHTPKPTVRSSTDISRTVRTPTTTGSSRPPIRKLLDKTPPPPLSIPQTSRDKTTPKNPSPTSRRTSISPKPIADKSSRTVKKATTPSITRVRSPGTSPRPAGKKEANASTPPVVSVDPYASDASSIKSEQDEKEIDPHIDDHDLVLEPLDIPSIVPPELTDSSEKIDPEVTAEIPSIENSEGEEKAEVEVTVESSEAAKVEEGEASKTEAPYEAAVEDIAVKAAEVEAPVPTKPPEVKGWKTETPRSNEVIEEFKSKMMEKRKSKVLALVGAFETVMSLQEPGDGGGEQHGKGV